MITDHPAGRVATALEERLVVAKALRAKPDAFDVDPAATRILPRSGLREFAVRLLDNEYYAPFKVELRAHDGRKLTVTVPHHGSAQLNGSAAELDANASVYPPAALMSALGRVMLASERIDEGDVFSGLRYLVSPLLRVGAAVAVGVAVGGLVAGTLAAIGTYAAVSVLAAGKNAVDAMILSRQKPVVEASETPAVRGPQ